MQAPLPGRPAPPPPPLAAIAAAATKAAFVRLPNGLQVRCVSRRDVRFLYNEVWGGQAYLKHGLELPRGGTVLDIGANIGLTTMMLAERLGPEGLVIACEPLPPTFACLQHNVAAHRRWRQEQAASSAGGSGSSSSSGGSSSPSSSSGSPGGEAPARIVPLDVGVSDGSSDAATFTLYPRAAGWSSMQPSAGAVQADMAAFLDNALASRAAADEAGLDPLTAAAGVALKTHAPRWLYAAACRAGVALLLGGAAAHTCRLVTVSQLIREHSLARVDLLKVDVERAELDVLRGIEPAHWPLIQQVALEVHSDALPAALAVLRESGGFAAVTVEQDGVLAGTSCHAVFCRR